MKKLLLSITIVFVGFGLNAQSNGYDKLNNSLRAFSDDINFTVFRGMDYNFVATKFDIYMQSNQRYASGDFEIKPTQISRTFKKKVGTTNEEITAIYKINTRNDIKGAFDAPEIYIIESVEISGSAGVIADIFLDYWRERPIIGDITSGGGKAYKQALGDYVSLHVVDDQTMKIKIGKGNMDVNYKTTYGINQPKNK